MLEMGEAALARGYEYLAICDHTRNVRVVPGLDADDIRRQGEEIAAANELLAPFRILRGSDATSSRTDRSTSPTMCSPSSTGCRPASMRANARPLTS